MLYYWLSIYSSKGSTTHSIGEVELDYEPDNIEFSDGDCDIEIKSFTTWQDRADYIEVNL